LNCIDICDMQFRQFLAGNGPRFVARQAASGSFDCVTRDETVSHFAQDDNSDGSAQLYRDALTGEGGFDGVGDAVVSVGAGDAPVARAARALSPPARFP